jgi:GMP synthase-like glutamine amidotransferase
MRWQVLQHVPFEGPAHFETWAHSRGHALSVTRLWTDALPRPTEFDGLFVLGGPMNVDEHDKHPWLAQEKTLIAQAVSQNKTVFGVCLGAQLISVALGGTVSRNAHQEIGWMPVELTPAGRDCPLLRGFPDQFTAFQWHSDRFTIPDGATHLARSAVCAEQAFVHGARVVGLQFHLESTEQSIAGLIEHCGDGITPGPTVQTPRAMQAETHHLSNTHQLLEEMLDALVQ